MGLLDSAIRKKVNQVINKTVGTNVTGAIGNAINNALNIPGQSQSGVQNSNASYGTPAYGTPVYQAPVQQAVNNDIRAMMPDILQSEFSGYAVQSGVAASMLGWGTSVAKPYDYVLYRNGAPVAAIMLTDHNRDRNAPFINAKAFCAQAGAAFINFYTHRPNRRDYVVNRIKGFLN